jgi:tripartite-type tricarboxylate transporter receptor subunit TctC
MAHKTTFRFVARMSAHARCDHSRRKRMKKLLALAAAIFATGVLTASAQDYPSRPVKLVVPFPAGGPTDTLARILTERMAVALGQPLVVENIGGASGSIGVGRVVNAEPDGYTLSIGHVQTHALNAATMNLGYDVVNDLAPVSPISDTPFWIIARKALPADDLKDLIAWLKARDGKATAATVGIGGAQDIAMLIFQGQTGTKFQFVPYRGGAPVIQDLLGEHIDLYFGLASTSLSYVRNGQLKAYAVLQRKRWWAAPEIPTLDELGIRGTDVTFWHGMWAPKGTPRQVIAKLNAAVRETLADPAVQERLKAIGQEVWPANEQTPEALAAKQKAELARWSPIIKEAGIRAE